MNILGIDPGLQHTGWGVISQVGNNLKFLGCGTISTDAKAPMEQRLLALHEGVRKVMDEFKPDISAIEETFVNANNKSSLKLGQARGALLLSLAQSGIPVREYAARLVKKTVVGTGAADKAQVEMMVQTLLPGCRQVEGKIRHDAYDALAVAVCEASHGSQLLAVSS